MLVQIGNSSRVRAKLMNLTDYYSKGGKLVIYIYIYLYIHVYGQLIDIYIDTGGLDKMIVLIEKFGFYPRHAV